MNELIEKIMICNIDTDNATLEVINARLIEQHAFIQELQMKLSHATLLVAIARNEEEEDEYRLDALEEVSLLLGDA